MSMGLGRAKSCGGGFKVITLRGDGGRGRTTKSGPVFMERVDPFVHHEGSSHYVILLFWNFILSFARYCKRLYRIPFFTILLLVYNYWDIKN